MNEQLAIQIVTEALDMAIRKGCYGLVETTNIAKALEFLNTTQNERNEQQPNDR